MDTMQSVMKTMTTVSIAENVRILDAALDVLLMTIVSILHQSAKETTSVDVTAIMTARKETNAIPREIFVNLFPMNVRQM